MVRGLKPFKAREDTTVSNANFDSPAASASDPPGKSSLTSGMILFIDQLIVAAGGWIFWLVINRLTSTSEIGSATAFYSLVVLITTITQLGLEYPLLKRSSSNNTKIFGTVLLIELSITAASIPVLLYVGSSIFGGSPPEFIWLSIGILLFTSLGFVSRFALLGVSNARSVLVFDLVATAVKFASGYVLVSAGYGAAGILWSFLGFTAIVLAGTLVLAKGKLSISLGSLSLAKELLNDGLANMPSKMSKMFVMSLSVVLLASIGVNANDVGVFYIILMISLTAGSFAASLAYMIIPSSALARADLSSDSMRIGLSFTAPLIVALLAQPQYTLSLLGDSYIAAASAFTVLALGILPAAILNNTIAHLNNVNRAKELVLVGIAQISAFLIAFALLTPPYGILGASIAITLGLSLSTILSFIWSLSRAYSRSVGVASASIFAGWLSAYSLEFAFPAAHPAGIVVTSVIVALAVVFSFKNISINEIRSMTKPNTATPNHNEESEVKDAGQSNGQKGSTGHAKKYFLLGNYGNFNIGDEVLLRAVVTDIMRGVKHDARFFVPTRNPNFVKIYHKSYINRITALSIGRPSRILNAFQKSDCIIVGGGGIWSGYTGPLAHLIPLITILGKIFGKRVEFRAIGLYSTASRLDKMLVNLAILVADSCSVRDHESYDMLWKVNQRRAKRVDDLAIQYLRNLDPTDIEAARTSLHETTNLESLKAGGKILIGISVKPVTNAATNLRIIQQFSKAISALNTRFPELLHFVFFPFAKTESTIESDNDMIKKIVRRLTKTDVNVTILDHLDPLCWFVGIREDIDAFIGMRLHSIIFASIAEKPVLCIPYEKKIEEFIKQNNDKKISVLSLDGLCSSNIAKFVETQVRDHTAGALA